MSELNTENISKKPFIDVTDTSSSIIDAKSTNTKTNDDIAYRRSILRKLKKIIYLETKLHPHTIKITENESLKTIRPKIYTCTTGGPNDLYTAFSLIKEPAWLPVAKPKKPTDFEKYLAHHHYITWYEASNDNMRQTLFDRQIKILQSGANIICFPELIPSPTPITISKLNLDYANLVVYSEAVIVPIGIVETIEQDSSIIYVTVGSTYDLTSLKKQNRETIIANITEKLKNLKRNSYEAAQKSNQTINYQAPSPRHLLIKRKR